MTDHFNVFALYTDFHPQCSLTADNVRKDTISVTWLHSSHYHALPFGLLNHHTIFFLWLNFIIVLLPIFNTATTWKRYSATQHFNIHTFLDLMSVSNSLIHAMMQKSSLQGHISLQPTLRSVTLLLIVVMMQIYFFTWVNEFIWRHVICHSQSRLSDLRLPVLNN